MPGDEVEIAFVHDGDLKNKKVMLTERRVVFNQEGEVRPNEENNPLWQGLGDLPKAEHDRMRELMKRRLEELNKQLENDGAIQFDRSKLLGQNQIDQLNRPADGAPAPDNEAPMLNFHAQSSITVMDEEGSVTIKVTDAHHEVIVTDKRGSGSLRGPLRNPQGQGCCSGQCSRSH